MVCFIMFCMKLCIEQCITWYFKNIFKILANATIAYHPPCMSPGTACTPLVEPLTQWNLLSFKVIWWIRWCLGAWTRISHSQTSKLDEWNPHFTVLLKKVNWTDCTSCSSSFKVTADLAEIPMISGMGDFKPHKWQMVKLFYPLPQGYDFPNLAFVYFSYFF